MIKPTDPLIVQRGRKKWAKKNADGEIVQPDDERGLMRGTRRPAPAAGGGNRSGVQ